MSPGMLLRLQGFGRFLVACWQLLPQFVSPSLTEALRRLALVLGASLAMVIVISTIDAAWLYTYLLTARRAPLAAPL